MDEPSIRYAPRPDATPESELEALVACYAFIIERTEERKAAERKSGGRQEDREGGEGGREPRATAG